jgi:hypothetical protein
VYQEQRYGSSTGCISSEDCCRYVYSSTIVDSVGVVASSRKMRIVWSDEAIFVVLTFQGEETRLSWSDSSKPSTAYDAI